MGRLQSTFHGSTLNDHGDKWDALWKESYTPWDRGGPSLALADLIREHPELFPPHNRGARRKTALVPGCGRGYDVLLLSALGYDVIGLDYSAVAVREAATNEQRVLGGRDKELYDSFVGHEGRGAVSWKEGDFFEDSWVVLVSRVHYDLIYDYTVSFHQPCF
jgi:SAM-dependent methyltransferase